MSKSLPPRPSLDHLRNEAKALLRRQRKGDTAVCGVLRRVARLRTFSDADILAARIALQEAQHALAGEYGFQGWKTLKDAIAQRPVTAKGAGGVSRLMRSDSMKLRMGALREHAVRIHPSWPGGTSWGWALGCKAPSIPAGVAELIGLLADPHWRIRRETVCALAAYAHLEDERVNKALLAAMADDTHAVQHAAARVLARECPGCGTSPKLSQYVKT